MTRSCTAQDIMSDVKVKIDLHDTLLEAMERMHRRKCPYALITEEGTPNLHLITMSDVVRAVHQKGELGDWLNEETVEQYMTVNLITVKATDLCHDVMRLFLETKVHQIVVMDELEPVGMITLLDLTTWFFGGL